MFKGSSVLVCVCWSDYVCLWFCVCSKHCCEYFWAVFLCLSVYMFVCLSFFVCVFLFTCLALTLFLCLSVLVCICWCFLEFLYVSFVCLWSSMFVCVCLSLPSFCLCMSIFVCVCLCLPLLFCVFLCLSLCTILPEYFQMKSTLTAEHEEKFSVSHATSSLQKSSFAQV